MFEVITITSTSISEFNEQLADALNRKYEAIGGTSSVALNNELTYFISLKRYEQTYSSPE